MMTTMVFPRCCWRRLVDFLLRFVFVKYSPFEWTLSYLSSTARVHADVYAVRCERLPRVPARGVLLVRHRSQVRLKPSSFFYPKRDFDFPLLFRCYFLRRRLTRQHHNQQGTDANDKRLIRWWVQPRLVRGHRRWWFHRDVHRLSSVLRRRELLLRVR